MNRLLQDVRREAALWGDWMRLDCTGLGYAPETPISRLLTSPGRASRRSYVPRYEPEPRARRFDNAYQQIDENQQVLLYCRFVLQMSDKLMCKRETSLKTEGQARWQIERAMKAVGRALWAKAPRPPGRISPGVHTA